MQTEFEQLMELTRECERLRYRVDELERFREEWRLRALRAEEQLRVARELIGR